MKLILDELARHTKSFYYLFTGKKTQQERLWKSCQRGEKQSDIYYISLEKVFTAF
jgi:hypothetical protein